MLKTKTFNIILISSLFALTGCGTVPGLDDLGAMKTGVQIKDEQLTNVRTNKTTQSDIVAMFGQPTRKSDSIWYYEFNQIGQAYIGKNISETTVFEFDKKGIVTAYYKTGGKPSGAKNELLKAAAQ